MAEQDVLYSKEDSIAKITLNRPEKLNALTQENYRRIHSLIEEVKKDEEVRALILTGNGRAFCSGRDLSARRDEASSMAQAEVKAAKEKATYDHDAFWWFNSIPKPTICAINGAAVGLGAEFTLHCDIRLASESARWGQVFVLRGRIPDTGAGTWLLPRIVGPSKACELVFSGEIIDAQEMLRIGLVSQVVPNEQLMPAAMEMAKKLTRGAPVAVQMCKQLIYRGLERTIEDHLRANRYYLSVCQQSEDYVEGARSFIEKREPRWSGR